VHAAHTVHALPDLRVAGGRRPILLDEKMKPQTGGLVIISLLVLAVP
jgi:hypothetical protein